MTILQSWFFRKPLFILFRINDRGETFGKLCESSWKHWNLVAGFYLTWFGQEMCPNSFWTSFFAATVGHLPICLIFDDAHGGLIEAMCHQLAWSPCLVCVPGALRGWGPQAHQPHRMILAVHGGVQMVECWGGGSAQGAAQGKCSPIKYKTSYFDVMQVFKCA
jgi:hypothetical protein